MNCQPIIKVEYMKHISNFNTSHYTSPKFITEDKYSDGHDCPVSSSGRRAKTKNTVTKRFH